MKTKSLLSLTAIAALASCKNPVAYETFRSETYDLDQSLNDLVGLRTLSCEYSKFPASGDVKKTSYSTLGECAYADLRDGLMSGTMPGYLTAVMRAADLADDIANSNESFIANIQIVPFIGGESDDGTLMTYFKSFRIAGPAKLPDAIKRAENHYFDHALSVTFSRPVLVERLLKGQAELVQAASFATGERFPVIQRILAHTETKSFTQDGIAYTGKGTVEFFASEDSDKPLLTLTLRSNWNPDVKSELKISRLWKDAPSSPVRVEVDFR